MFSPNFHKMNNNNSLNRGNGTNDATQIHHLWSHFRNMNMQMANAIAKLNDRWFSIDVISCMHFRTIRPNTPFPPSDPQQSWILLNDSIIFFLLLYLLWFCSFFITIFQLLALAASFFSWLDSKSFTFNQINLRYTWYLSQ